MPIARTLTTKLAPFALGILLVSKTKEETSPGCEMATACMEVVLVNLNYSAG